MTTWYINRYEVDAILRNHPHRAAVLGQSVVIYHNSYDFVTLGAGTDVVFEHMGVLAVGKLQQLSTLGWTTSAGPAMVTRANFRGIAIKTYVIKP
jgi:hypothetical protein